MKRPARGLDMVLKHLATRTGFVEQAKGFSPNAARHAPDDHIFGIHAIREKEREVGRKVVNLHPP